MVRNIRGSSRRTRWKVTAAWLRRTEACIRVSGRTAWQTAQAHSSILKDPHTTAIGLMTSSTDTAVKLGMKARLNSKANTIKERKMGAEDTNGLTEATTMVILSIACSRVRVSLLVTSLTLPDVRHLLLCGVWENIRGIICPESFRR